MTDRELMQQALEALEWHIKGRPYVPLRTQQAFTALNERLAQPEPEFIKHHGDDEGWSEWVCPDPDDYLISCCDCGLVHQAQFRVAKYAPAPSEECEVVNDPDLQAQFRMRRHAVTKPQPDNWTPEDTAHRAGGLAQPEQEPVFDCPRCGHCCPQRKPLTDEEIDKIYETKVWDARRSFARAIEAAHGIKENT